MGIIHMLIEFSALFLREVFAQSNSDSAWVLEQSRHMCACLYLQGVESVH